MGDEEGQSQDGGELSKQKSTTPPIPKAPDPEKDAGLVPDLKTPLPEDFDIDPDNLDIFTLAPVAALKLLCRNVDTLVRMTGDVPPHPTRPKP